jgi:hypothetical protein
MPFLRVLDNLISVYEFTSLPTPSSRIFSLPLSPSHVGGFLWSSDNQKLYFLDLPGYDSDMRITSNGLWYLDVQSGKIEKVANVPDPDFFLESVSPDGERILLMHEVPPGEAVAIQLSDGKTQSWITDIHAMLAGWQ